MPDQTRPVPAAECPDPSVHGNPLRYCPFCEWIEETKPVHTDRLTDEQLRRIAEGTDLYPDERTPQATGIARMAAELIELRARITELEAAHAAAVSVARDNSQALDDARAKRGHIGWVTGHRHADGKWHIAFDGEPWLTLDEAKVDVQHASAETPDVEWRALAVYAETWRPSAREITDPTELDALPRGSAVLTRNGRVWQKAVTAATEWWPALGNWSRAATSERLLGLGIVTVLHIPADDWLRFVPAHVATEEDGRG
ncbi:hypothetical protein [Nocardia sp. SC052]|uniref:hypothetical protein n=1 Tax=Nocardia sichangensis TaxID=3385975 RepID=UPI00399F72A5